MCCCCSCGKCCEKTVIACLEKLNPGLGVKEIVRLLNLIRKRLSDDENYQMSPVKKLTAAQKSSDDEEADEKDTADLPDEITALNRMEDMKIDGKWRPMVITLGLMYKLQKTQDDSWYDAEEVFVPDKDRRQKLVDVFGSFWKYLYSISWALILKKSESKRIVEKISEGLEVKQEDVIQIHMNDAKDLQNHAPDTFMVIHHSRKEIVLTLCGTKLTPTPSLGDIMLDLHADSIDYMSGRAHQGMAVAAENIYKIFEENLKKSCSEHPDYRLIVVGYSLGAGVSQLVTLALLQRKLLPPETKIYCLAYGAPPIFRAEEHFYSPKNIFSIVHHNDGLATFSLNTLTKLFLQVRAIDSLKLSRRRMLSLLRCKLVKEEIDAAGVRRHVCNNEVLEKGEWKQILSKVEGVRSSGFDELDMVGGNLFMVKKTDEDYVIRHLNSLEMMRNLSSNLKLRSDCFSDHMPWGYSGLFKEAGKEGYDLDILDEYIDTA